MIPQKTRNGKINKINEFIKVPEVKSMWKISTAFLSISNKQEVISESEDTKKRINSNKLSMVSFTHNLSIQEAEAGGPCYLKRNILYVYLRVWGW